MEYRLLVLDIDGTLTNTKGEITDRTVEAINRAQQQGVKIVLASGRPTHGIIRVAEQLSMAQYGGYILSFNGGRIEEYPSRRQLFSSTFSRELIPALYDLSRGRATIMSYRDNFIISENPEDEHAQIEIGITKMDVLKVESFVEAVDFDPNKSLIVGDPEVVTAIGEQINNEYGEHLTAYRSFPYFLEVVPLGIDKALSLSSLIEQLGITREEVIAIGDGFNDQTMIEFAGLGVAMANGQPCVREAADIVALSNDEDGVADIIDRYIL
ncbi:MAG: Cof-type HAD-IIB family hydrolase [Rikenellaceae bacterium]